VTAPDTLARLLRQARQWFSPHPQRADAVSVEAHPAEVLGWMADTDHALLDEVADAQVADSTGVQPLANPSSPVRLRVAPPKNT
jgi:hypothetical protein